MNNEQGKGNLGNALIYEDYVPLFAISLSPDDPRLMSPHQFELQNLNTLKMLWYMQENFHDLPEQYHDLEPAFQRLDNKIDMLLQMAGQLLGQSQQLPPTTRIRLNSASLSWLSSTGAEVGSIWLVQAYVLSSVPIPLSLLGEITAVHPEAGQYWNEMALQSLGGPAVDLLDKIIFRAHRRAVAQQRRSTSSRP